MADEDYFSAGCLFARELNPGRSALPGDPKRQASSAASGADAYLSRTDAYGSVYRLGHMEYGQHLCLCVTKVDVSERTALLTAQHSSSGLCTPEVGSFCQCAWYTHIPRNADMCYTSHQ